MSLTTKIGTRTKNIYLDFLKVDSVRYYVCRIRWAMGRRKLIINRQHGSEVAPTAIDYNLTAFDNPSAAFGMKKRMSLLLFPLAALLREQNNAKVLIVGPRTEDDILWAHSLGLRQARGLDLFSYSKLIDVGDMHKTQYENHQFDAVAIGWTLAYSTQPEVAIQEAKRILKPGGLLAIGMESLDPSVYEHTKEQRANRVNNLDDLKALIHDEIVFVNDPEGRGPRQVAVIFKIK